jgi:acetyltransferase-like isoleucine patch superfamily enzyme
MKNILIEKNTELTVEEKRMFAYFGEGAKIRPPFRILNPQNIFVGDKTSVREHAFIHAYTDLSDLMNYIDPLYVKDFNKDDYLYNSTIMIGREVQIGRFLLMSCTNFVQLEDHVLLSERVFVGDNNHSFSHPYVPIIQQPNKKGTKIVIGRGSWIGVGAAILSGTSLGQNCIVGANSVVDSSFPSHSVIGTEKAKLLFRRYDDNSLSDYDLSRLE